jgi:hypothetical protein
MTGDERQGYEERYCAFVDILGFSQLVEGLRDGSTSFTSLRELLTKLRKSRHVPDPFPDSDFRAQSISDAVALSTKPSAASLSLLFGTLEVLTIDLLAQGFFVRGAVVKDRLYHDDSVVFGDSRRRDAFIAMMEGHPMKHTPLGRSVDCDASTRSGGGRAIVKGCNRKESRKP